MRGFSKLEPSQPRWRSEDTAWDPGLIIQYWMDQPDNMLLTDTELAFKSFALLWQVRLGAPLLRRLPRQLFNLLQIL